MMIVVYSLNKHWEICFCFRTIGQGRTKLIQASLGIKALHQSRKFGSFHNLLYFLCVIWYPGMPCKISRLFRSTFVTWWGPLNQIQPFSIHLLSVTRFPNPTISPSIEASVLTFSTYPFVCGDSVDIFTCFKSNSTTKFCKFGQPITDHQ